MYDFTFDSFGKLLDRFRSGNFLIVPFSDFYSRKWESGRCLILRHDVDRFPFQTLRMARMEAAMDIASTYFFRIVPTIFKPEIIREVAAMGHEIGYHYEDLSICNGDTKKSIDLFERNLDRLREFYPVRTICMHGSPLSKWDNKSLWKHYNYKSFGIEADTSLDVDYNKVFYISDNGRGWNRTGVSIRDKVDTAFNIKIKDTNHLIELVKTNSLPDHIMLNAHPDTFFDFGIRWLLNFGYIELKNSIKWMVVKTGIIK